MVAPRFGFGVETEVKLEMDQADGGAGGVWDQLQHRPVWDDGEIAFVSATLCGDADECTSAGERGESRSGAYGMRDDNAGFDGQHDAGEWVWVFDGRDDSEQLFGEQELSAGDGAGVQREYPADVSDGDRVQRWIITGRRAAVWIVVGSPNSTPAGVSTPGGSAVFL